MSDSKPTEIKPKIVNIKKKCNICKSNFVKSEYIIHMNSCDSRELIYKWKLITKKIIWLIKNTSNITNFIDKVVKDNLNNETIGESAETAICKISKIVCNITDCRVNKIIVDRLYKQLQIQKILEKIPAKIISSSGYKNGSVDFNLMNNDTLSLKTLKWKDGKICPQKVGQPTLKSWDNIWEQKFLGEKDKNPQRWEFIKSNIHLYLNRMLDGVFCCNHLIIIKNCMDKPKIILYKNELLEKIKNYFKNQKIIYTREEYEERWDEKRKKYNEFSSTIKIEIENKEYRVGEFQFHKSSRKEVKFRFWDDFLQKLF